MPSLSDTHSIIHAVFHDWHWHRREYIMASSTLMSSMAIWFSVRSSKKAGQISIRSQVLGVCDNYIREIPSTFPSKDKYAPEFQREVQVREFYSKMVTLVQIIDGSGLDRKNRASIKEFFWLQLTSHFWDEMAQGEGHLYAKDACTDEAHIDTLDGHRRTACLSFKAIINKHHKKGLTNLPPKIKKKESYLKRLVSHWIKFIW